MAATSVAVARAPVPLLGSGLATGALGVRLHRAVAHRVRRSSRAFPMIATFAFTLTNINLAQADAAPVRRPRQLRRTCSTTSRRGTSLGVTLKYALLALPVAVVLPFLVALMLHSRHLRGAGVFRVLFFLPYVVPFVAGVLIWGGMLNPDTGWLNAALQAHRHRSTRRRGWRTRRWIYPGLVIMGVWGIGAGMIVYLAGLKGIPTELYEAARIDGAGRLGVAAPHHDPDDVAGHLLHARAGAWSRCSSTSSCRSSSRTGPVSPAARRSSSTSTSTRTSSRSRTCPTGRRWRGCCSRSRWSSRCSCSGSRGAGSTTRARRARWPCVDARSRWPTHRAGPAASRRRRPTAAARRASAATGARSFLLTLIAVLVLAAFLSPMLRSFTYAIKSTRPDHPGRLAALAGGPGDVLVPGQGAADPAGPHRRRRRGSSRCSSRAASRARSSTRRTRTPAPIRGRARGGRSSTSGRSPRTGRTSARSGTSSTTRGCCSTPRPSRSSRRSGRCCRARSWRTGSPASGSPAGTCCSRC